MTEHPVNMLKHDQQLCPSYKDTSTQYINNGDTELNINSIPHDVTNVTATDTDELDIDEYPFETKLHFSRKSRLEMITQIMKSSTLLSLYIKYKYGGVTHASTPNNILYSLHYVPECCCFYLGLSGLPTYSQVCSHARKHFVEIEEFR